jgi:hypothetical protein
MCGNYSREYIYNQTLMRARAHMSTINNRMRDVIHEIVEKEATESLKENPTGEVHIRTESFYEARAMLNGMVDNNLATFIDAEGYALFGTSLGRVLLSFSFLGPVGFIAESGVAVLQEEIQCRPDNGKIALGVGLAVGKTLLVKIPICTECLANTKIVAELLRGTAAEKAKGFIAEKFGVGLKLNKAEEKQVNGMSFLMLTLETVAGSAK